MIDAMKTLAILLAIALAGVVLVLIVGLVAMARGGEFNRKYGNKLMRARVAMQGLAIVLFLLFVLAASTGD
ncbi:MAG: twin transmembrane helix small protein [Alphaproteobacteria bacterium]